MIGHIADSLRSRIKATYHAGLIEKKRANIVWQDMRGVLLQYQNGALSKNEASDILRNLITKYGIL